MTNERAETVGVGVGGVLAPQRARFVAHRVGARLDEGAQFIAARLEQGAAHAAPFDHDAMVHRAETAGARSHDRAHIEVLDAVVGRMRREDTPRLQREAHMQARAFERLAGRAVALGAGDGFHIAARRPHQLRHVDIAHEQRDAQALGQRGDECRVAVGRRAAQVMAVSA